ncbi:hypothetical protein BGW41_001025 [Actinomortierella wolfii]|nr:hypothetical protein BGW41_001025 [Actinomortierella wolfii]
MASPPDTRPSTPGTPLALTVKDAFEFDERQFAAAGELDKQANPPSTTKRELFVFQWLAGVDRELKKCSHDALRVAQASLERQLLKLISLPSPKPRHPIRRLIARCFLTLYIRGSTTTLFETIQILQSLIEAGKGLGDKDVKMAAIHCIGAIMETVGDRVQSLVPEIVATLLKVIRTDKIYPLIMRVEAMEALRKVLHGAGRGSNEVTGKEILKTLKTTMLDKALMMRSTSANCFTALIKNTDTAFTRSEIDASIAIFIKAMDESTYAIRKSTANLIATLLYSKCQREETLTMVTQPPTTNKNAPGDAFTMEVSEVLAYLGNAYNKPNTSREVRAGLAETYAAFFIMLGPSVVERNYGIILRHLLTELASNSRNTTSRFEILTVREHVEYLLRGVIGTRLLSESGQIAGVRELVGSWLKLWPAVMPADVEPSEYILICALNETSALVLDLGGAASSVQDILMSALTNLVAHPSKAVQMAVAWCLRCFCISLPANLAKLLQTLIGKLSTDLSALNNNGSNFQDIANRAFGTTHAAGALIAVIPVHPLYVSFEMSARIFSTATQLIKNSANKELRIAAVQIQIAWVLIGALMCLGQNFVKMHLPQLLLLWKNALPKPSSKDNTATRTELDWAFMMHVRECALGSMASFLLHNDDKVVTVDVTKRVAALLSNSLAFAAMVPATFPSTQTNSKSQAVQPQHELLAVKMSERDDALRKRIFECFGAMRHTSAFEMYHSTLIKAALDVFSDPERTSGTPVSNAIASSSFTTIWAIDDGYGYGVTGKIQGLRCDVAGRTSDRQEEILDAKDYDSATKTTETLLQKPILGALEHDPMVVYTTYALPSSISRYSLPKPRPVATGVIDAAVELFAILYPLQSSSLQGSLMEALSKILKNNYLDKNPGRKMAIHVNTIVAMLGATKYAMSEGRRAEQRPFEGPLASSYSQSILRDAIVHTDPYLRFVACEALGRLTSLLGSATIAAQIKYLMDQVVANRDPDARAGYALALGNVFSHLGGMVAGGHLRSIVEYLTSLSRDPHPIVHKWSLHSLALTIESAGLMYSPYVNSTLTNVATVYLAESHEPAGAGSVATANIAMQSELSVYHEMGRIIYGLIGILGPELQSSAKVRELCVSLVEELRNEDDEFVIVQGIRCTQHLIMFAPQLVDMATLVPFLQARLRRSTGLSLKKAAMTCMYQLVQKDVKTVFQNSKGGLDDQFFKLLDTDPTLYDVKDVVRSWISQTALEQPSQWIEICRKVLSRTAIDEGMEPTAGAPGSGDAAGIEPTRETRAGSGGNEAGSGNAGQDGGFDEDEELDAFDSDEKPVQQTSQQPTQPTPAAASTIPNTTVLASDSQEVRAVPALPPRWRTRVFALECIRQVIDAVATSGIADHFDLIVARRKKKTSGADFLVLKVADLVKMTVYAASTPIREIRLEGLRLLRLTIERFKSTIDPEVPESVLLEQYQAQIGAALTPAFTAESTPEVVALGVKVCAVYIGSGIIQQVDRFGRVLKLLMGALDKCKHDKRVTVVGDVTDLTPQASQMIKWAVLNAWAELQVASVHQQYLVEVLKPNLEELCKLWANALEEFARSRVEAEVVTTSSTNTTASLFEASYSSLHKDGERSFDQSSTLKILKAVSTLLDEENKHMIQALMRVTSPGETTTVDESKKDNRDEGSKGAEDGSTQDNKKPVKKPRGPYLLVHVVFGLCLEILAKTSSTGGTTMAGNSVMTVTAAENALQACLKTLQSILDPKYIDKEFITLPIFLEMMTILERVAWIERSHTQVLVAGMIAKLIQGYGQDLLFTEEEEGSKSQPVLPQDNSESRRQSRVLENGSGNDSESSFVSSPVTVEPPKEIPFNAPLSQLSALPGKRLYAVVQLLTELAIQKCHSLNPKSSKVVGRRVVDMLTSLVKVSPPKYQLHLAAVTLHILVGILRDPLFQVELGGRVLVNMKTVFGALEKTVCDTEDAEENEDETEEDANNIEKTKIDTQFLGLILNGTMAALIKTQANYAPGNVPLDTTFGSNSSSAVLSSIEGRSTRDQEDAEMDVSQAEITAWCNGLLAMMVLVTSRTRSHLLDEYLDKFERMLRSSIESSVSQVVTAGFQCLRSMILMESQNMTDSECHNRARKLIQRFVPLVVTTIVVKAVQERDANTTTALPMTENVGAGAGGNLNSEKNGGNKQGRIGMHVIEEGIQTLKSLAGGAAKTDEARAIIVGVLLSTIVPLLHEDVTQPPKANAAIANQLHEMALNHLLNLGTTYPKEFRHGLLQLSQERRSRLENAIRQNVLQQQEQLQKKQAREEAERQRLQRERDRVQIQLKSSFDGFM